jgi:hypothetical protein
MSVFLINWSNSDTPPSGKKEGKFLRCTESLFFCKQQATKYQVSTSFVPLPAIYQLFAAYYLSFVPLFFQGGRVPVKSDNNNLFNFNYRDGGGFYLPFAPCPLLFALCPLLVFHSSLNFEVAF